MHRFSRASFFPSSPLALAFTFAFVAACSSSSSTPTSPAPAATDTAPPDPVGNTDVGYVPKAPGTPYAVQGNVLGLTGTGLVLQNNGADDLAISANGPFAFATKIPSGNQYYVRVSTPPSNPAQLCTVTGALGTVGSGDVTDVFVQCKNSYAIKATVSGLTGAGLVLVDGAGGDPLSVTGNGLATFPTRVVDGTAYAIVVGTQPSGQTCTVQNGAGTVSGADVTTPTVTCL
jgi:hypothetical protein